MHRIAQVVAAWRDEARGLERRGLEREARILESVAEDLELAVREWELETLSLSEAAEESGLAYDTIRRKVAEGEIPNAGEKGSPRVRRCDLPWIQPPRSRGGRIPTGEPEEVAEAVAGEILQARRVAG